MTSTEADSHHSLVTALASKAALGAPRATHLAVLPPGLGTGPLQQCKPASIVPSRGTRQASVDPRAGDRSQMYGGLELIGATGGAGPCSTRPARAKSPS